MKPSPPLRGPPLRLRGKTLPVLLTVVRNPPLRLRGINSSTAITVIKSRTKIPLPWRGGTHPPGTVQKNFKKTKKVITFIFQIVYYYNQGIYHTGKTGKVAGFFFGGIIGSSFYSLIPKLGRPDYSTKENRPAHRRYGKLFL